MRLAHDVTNMAKQLNQEQDGAKVGESDDKRFLLDFVYPDPAAAISFKPAPIAQMRDEAIIFLDTNVLLLPYSTGKNSLADIAKIYSNLISDQRLVVPARVMQEFLKNSPDKLKEIFQKLSRQKNINVPVESYPLLENIEQYADLLIARNELIEKLKVFQKRLGDLVGVIQDWHHDDPVRRVYSKIFGADQIVALEAGATGRLGNESTFRYENKIPPGYKDASKDDSGIGDLAIWKTILQVARNKKKHGIFVCGEEKADWWHRSENQPLMVRHELIDEYRRESDGKTFRLLGMSDFLALFGAQDSVVEEVKEEQKSLVANWGSYSTMATHAEEALVKWFHSRHGGLITLQPNGADFSIESQGRKLLVEVKIFSRVENVHGQMAEIYSRSVKLREQGLSFSEFVLALVAANESEALALALEVEKWRGEIANWVTFLCGFLDEKGDFVEVHKA